MPDSPHSFLTMLCNIPTETKAVLAAVAISAMRVVFDHEETKPTRIILESLLCGALSYTANYGLEAAGADSHWSVFVGGMIGYIGSAAVRELAIKLINKKIESKK